MKSACEYLTATRQFFGDPEQRKAMPDIAAESDERSKKLARQVTERLGPTMRKRAEGAGA